MKNPYTLVSSKTVYSNPPWMQVREDHVLNVKGEDQIFGVTTIYSGVSVLALDDQLNTYLVNEFHYALDAESLEAVSGGRHEHDESFLDCAKRELREETGIVAEHWVKLGVIQPLTTIFSCPQHLFLARKLQFTQSNPDKTEDIALIKLPLADAVEKVFKSEIVHAPSAVLILKADAYLKKPWKTV